MQIETSKGTFDEAELDCEVVPHEAPDVFSFEHRYRLRGSDEVIAVYRREEFKKVNAFAAPPADGMILIERDGVRSTVPIATLERTLGQRDNDVEFSSWVEYRDPGSDVIVHRSAFTRLKKPTVFASGVAADLGGGPPAEQQTQEARLG
jgi:hypothetical protein